MDGACGGALRRCVRRRTAEARCGGACGGVLRRRARVDSRMPAGAVTRSVAQRATCAPDSHERSGADGGGLT